MRTIMRTKVLPIVCPVVQWLCGAAAAQPVPDYGLEWRTIGDPGNPAAQPADYHFLQSRGFGPVGQVDYEYRLTRTEVTNTQWFEFLDAYIGVRPEAISDLSVVGRDIYYTMNGPGDYNWYTAPGAENAAVTVGWFSAARFSNWLHNGKSATIAAFENGAYDMGSFYVNPEGWWVGETQRSPDARFWLPSWDEWTKGMHWDPNKFGQEQGGYWMYPHSSDERPIGGLPGTPGAETSADHGAGPIFYVPVGSYPNSTSPWDLLDGSGGAAEYLGLWVNGVPNTRGSPTAGHVFPGDRLDYLRSTFFPNLPGGAGIRLASVVPSPGVFLFVAAAALCFFRRRA